MRVCVYGCWHLGSVTAACVAEAFPTSAFDPDPSVRARLREGKAPIFEPGLDELLGSGVASKSLRVADSLDEAVVDADVVWVAFDTPVREDDSADIASVEAAVTALFPKVRENAVVVFSSQLPVGFTDRMKARCDELRGKGTIGFAYSPENLRLGSALSVFRNADRIVIGVDDDAVRKRLEPLFSKFSTNLLWMGVRSAEMTKHALNGFLAVSVAFINEIASICEVVGADAADVARGLKSDIRIGPKAYLGPGAAFAGGTLARDLVFLKQIASERGGRAKILSSVVDSNNDHKQWARGHLLRKLGSLLGKHIAVWGLTYKQGTNTLRRSEAMALCAFLLENGARVKAFDPSVSELEKGMRGPELCQDPQSAVLNADALVVATDWPIFKNVSADDLCAWMKAPLVLDANRFLGKEVSSDKRIHYVAVGKSDE